MTRLRPISSLLLVVLLLLLLPALIVMRFAEELLVLFGLVVVANRLGACICLK
jgi:hypothetical protein